MPIMGGGGGGGGAAFNGGTITQPLVINHDDIAPLLSVLGSDDGAQGRAGAVVTGGGQLTVNAESGSGLRVVADFEDPAKNFSLLDASEGEFTVNLSDLDVGTVFQVRNAGGSRLIRGGYNNNGEIIVGFAAGLVGFYGKTGIAQGTLTSGTATPEQITLALQALGLVGGS